MPSVDSVPITPTSTHGCLLGAVAVTYLAAGSANTVNWHDVSRVYSGLDTTVRSAIPHRIQASAATPPRPATRPAPTTRPHAPAPHLTWRTR